MLVLIVVGMLIGVGCSDKKEAARRKYQEEYRAKIDYKQAYKQAIDKYKHLTIEELDYAIDLAFQQPRHIPIPKDLHAAYQQRHKQRYKKEMKKLGF